MTRTTKRTGDNGEDILNNGTDVTLVFSSITVIWHHNNTFIMMNLYYLPSLCTGPSRSQVNANFCTLGVFITFCNHFVGFFYRSYTKLFSTDQAIKNTMNGLNLCRLWIWKVHFQFACDSRFFRIRVFKSDVATSPSNFNGLSIST